MSTAGQSARLEAERAHAMIEAHEAAIEAERQRFRNFMIAAETEQSTARALAPLAAAGHHLLADRRWPGSRSAQVDLVVVGPTGVWIVDTKSWRDLSIAAGRVYRDQEDVTDTFENLDALGETTRSALVEVGLPPAEVHVVAAWTGRSNVRESFAGVEILGERDVLKRIARSGQRLSDVAIDTVLSAVLALFPPVSAPAPVTPLLPIPVLDLAATEPEVPELATETEIQEAILESLMAAPVEDWMTFLHPDQARLIRRSFAGPSRIRGAAGTGKTVVGLHRAAHLARNNPESQVLVTTFVRTLPSVLRSLMRRLAPDVSERIDFLGVHEFASRLLRERGAHRPVDGRRADRILDGLWSTPEGRSLAAIENNPAYWREEIHHVIKGRGFTEFPQYAECPRPGRRRVLGANQRRDVWAFYCAYERELRASGLRDHMDQILLAEAELRRAPLERYCAVIVDEAQDLSLAMVRMLHALVGDRPDGFTLIGDGQQSIYPGGYTLAEAGISVATRGVVLNINYRNTAEILARAEQIVAGDLHVEIDGQDAAPFSGVEVAIRHGDEPVARVFDRAAEHDAAVVEQVRALTRSIGTGCGDIGVLCTSNAQADRAIELLRREQIPVVSLTDYDGTQTEAVKIGTINRAKGLEFKQVLLPWTKTALLRLGGSAAAATPESLLEREERDRRILYVGMTRARDGLWVGAVRSARSAAA